MNQIDDLFDRMDAWRHLPSYQLERRADLFFSLYLAEAIEAKFGFPAQLRDIMSSRDLRCATDASRLIQISAKAAETLVLYLQPNGSGPDFVCFEEFRAVVQRHDDPISRRFAQSLAEWTSISAGEIPLRDQRDCAP